MLFVCLFLWWKLTAVCYCLRNISDSRGFPGRSVLLFSYIPDWGQSSKVGGGPAVGTRRLPDNFSNVSIRVASTLCHQKLDKRSILTLLPPAYDFLSSFEQVTGEKNAHIILGLEFLCMIWPGYALEDTYPCESQIIYSRTIDGRDTLTLSETPFVSVEQHHRWTSTRAINAEQRLTNEGQSLSGAVIRFASLATSTSGTDAFSLGSEGRYEDTLPWSRCCSSLQVEYMGLILRPYKSVLIWSLVVV